MKKIAKFVEMARLPVMPEVASKLIPTLSEEFVDIVQLRDVVSKDPALTAMVLRWANSPLHALSKPVTTLDAAISILGISKVRAQAIAACLAGAFDLPQGMDRERFWTQSMRCAGYAMWLALAVGLDESEAWLTGMLLRLGEVLIYQYDKAAARQLSQTQSMAVARWVRQRELVGFDEGQVMGEAARSWHFPKDMTEALDHCAHPFTPDHASSRGAILHLAVLLSEMDSVDEDGLKRLPVDVVTRLGINVAWISQHIPDASQFVDMSSLN